MLIVTISIVRARVEPTSVVLYPDSETGEKVQHTRGGQKKNCKIVNGDRSCGVLIVGALIAGYNCRGRKIRFYL